MAELTEIKATKEIPKDSGIEKEAVIFIDFGADVNDAVAKFGAEVVFSNFKRSATITAQAALRRLMEANKTQEEITTAMAGWKPGVSLERSFDPVKALTNKFATMTPEEQNKIIEDLMARAGKA